jgi:signal transduction histidine kinase/CheY-like chemotaxis protein
VVHDVGRRITSILDQRYLFREVVRRVAHSFNIELVVLYLIDGDDLCETASYFLPEDSYGFWEPSRLKIGQEGICGIAAGEGRPILAPDVSKHPGFLRMLPVEQNTRSAVAVPLKLKGQVIGVLLAESENLAAFDQTDVDTLEALSAYVSTSIENARLYTETLDVQSKLVEAEKLRSLGMMTSGIAHDFNNLLAVILARAELALLDIDDPKIRAHIEQVISSAKDGGETIHRLQDFARTREDTSDFVGVDLNQVAREAVELSRPRWKDQAQSGGLDIEVVLDLEANRTVLGAPVQLREILVNLIFNAVEAMPEGGMIRIETFTDDKGATLVVEDTGIGMTPDVKKQIFVPYFTTKNGGTGLGLSMVYGVVRRHAGKIEVTSQPGEGTCVSVWLPLSPEVEQKIKLPAKPSIVEPIRTASILIVEDEAPIREGLREIFEKAGHTVILAGDGKEGLEKILEADRVDIVFTDLGMPNLSGWELIEKIRAIHPKLPIVILSGWGDEVDPIKVREFGISIVMGKPFSVSELHTALHTVLNGR